MDVREQKKLKEALYFKELDNGLKVYFIPREDYTKQYAVFATNYGSNDNKFIPLGEEEPITVPKGIAHFLEHKLFEEKEGNIFSKFSDLGSYVNAYTNFNQTAYLFSCSDKFYENLKLLVKFVQNPYFTDENVNKEKGIIEQEIKMYDDNPNWKVFFNCLKAMYVNHPVKTDIAGTVDSIKKIDKETLYKCYNTFYHPSNMVLFMVGNINFDKALNVVKENIDRDIKEFHGEVKKITEKEPTTINKKIIEEKLSVSNPLFNIGFKDIDLGYTGDELLKRQLTTNILLDMLFGDSTKFYQSIYDEGLISGDFGTQYIGHESYGHSIIAGESDEPKKVLKRVKDHIINQRENGLNKEAFNRNKRKLIGYYLMDLNSVEFIANNFIKYHFNNTSILSYLDILENINYNDVKERFENLFDLDRLSISIIYPI
ncbi:MAG: insulinase family protein [Firmicutes bacterium]|nr:insulinase family protein [Bacillota bacterium]